MKVLHYISTKTKMAATGGKLPELQRIKSIIRDELSSLLDVLRGTKDLVIEPDLMKPLDRVAGASLLKQRGVDKIFKLDSTQKSIQGNDQRVYLVRPRMTTMKTIADHINADISHNIKRKYNIIVVPRKLHTCEMILEHEGVYGHVTIHELQMDLIPLDQDILSLELPEFFRTFYLDNDSTWIHTVAKSLIGLQAFTGTIPNVYCIGKGAKMVNELMTAMLGDRMVQPDYSRHEIGSMILIDRDVDFVTPLCSQLTYEGLLDDTFGINCGNLSTQRTHMSELANTIPSHILLCPLQGSKSDRIGFVEFGPEVTGKDQNVKLLLTSDDQIFEEVRTFHFSTVLSYLSTKAKSLQQDFDKRHGLKSVGDMKDFVANELRTLKQQKSVLAYHIGACEQILNKKSKGEFEEYLQCEHSLLEGSELRENITFIEELINKQDNMLKTLKLLCLLSLTQSGIAPKDYKSLKTQYLQSHGFEQMLTFYNLKKLGILTEQESSSQSGSTPLNKVTSSVAAIAKRSSYRNLCKRLNLIPKSDEINLKSPTDMAYVFSGAYTPLSCKLVDQVLVKEGFSGMEEVIKYLPGGVDSKVRIRQVKGKAQTSNQAVAKVVLVYFLGGCSYSEITALRHLGRLKGYKFIVATTSIFNGTSILETVMEKPPL